MNRKIGLIGYTGESVGDPIVGGQMAKTKGIQRELIRKYGEDSVCVVDTSNWHEEKIRLLTSCMSVARTCKTIIIMPNKNGIKVILPLFAALKLVFRYRLCYPVVGGWLPGSLEKHGLLRKAIKKVDFVLPETESLRKELEGYVDCRMEEMPIFSTRKPLEQVQYQDTDGIKRFCTFSRVTPEKGIDEAIKAVKNVNSSGKVCHLDVWGPIERGYEEHYADVFAQNAENIRYCGVLSGEDALIALAQYYMMLFPSYYPGEGFPTSVCEGFMAGLPVIASDWRFNGELIHDGETGYLYPVHDISALESVIKDVCKNEESVITMKEKALAYSKRFEPEEVMQPVFEWIDE